jgi:general stress protein 26
MTGESLAIVGPFHSFVSLSFVLGLAKHVPSVVRVASAFRHISCGFRICVTQAIENSSTFAGEITMTGTDEKLLKLLREFDVAMLVTRSEDGSLRARPMAIAAVESDGTVWLVTDRHSGKMDEIGRDSQVSVTMQSSSKFVSLSGVAFHSEDRGKIAELWNESWKVWFPGGKDDPNLTLLGIQGQNAEYWDNSGFHGLKYVFEAGKAYLSGTRPAVDSDSNIHAKIEL